MIPMDTAQDNILPQKGRSDRESHKAEADNEEEVTETAILVDMPVEVRKIILFLSFQIVKNTVAKDERDSHTNGVHEKRDEVFWRRKEEEGGAV